MEGRFCFVVKWVGWVVDQIRSDQKKGVGGGAVCCI